MRRKLFEKNTPKWWNIRQLTEDNFWDFCDERKICVREAQIEQPGYSIKIDGQNFIFVRDDLRGIDRTYTLWHEMGHYFLHPQRIQFFLGLDKTVELEANAFAACALIPRTWLNEGWIGETAKEYGYPEWLIKFRQTLLQYWEI